MAFGCRSRPYAQEPLQSTARAAIVDHLRQHECASVTELCRDLSLSWGSAQHHLYVLGRAGLVFRAKSGRSTLHFPAGTEPLRARTLALLRSPRAKQIVRMVQEAPGIRQKEACERLRMIRKVFRHHLGLLAEAGLIEEGGSAGTGRIYRPTQAIARARLGPASAENPLQEKVRVQFGPNRRSTARRLGLRRASVQGRAPDRAA